MKISDYLTLTRDTLNAYYRMCEPILLNYDIPQVSFDILMFLKNNPAHCTAQDISEVRGIKKNLVSVHVDKLVRAGLLQRGAFSGDRRKIALSCTGKAEAIIADGLAMQQEFFQMLFAGVEEEEWKAYRLVNDKIALNTKAMQKRMGGTE